jgi:hypothetical protein
MARATYLYCIVKSARKPSLARVPAGLPGGDRPSVVECAPSLWLAISLVPLDRYGPGSIEPMLRDLDQVSAIALAHEAVVEHFVRQRGGAVVPMKLFTMFSTPARAAAEMRRQQAGIVAVFERIAGAEEWGVRVIRGRPRAKAGAPARAATGAAFLARRKQARDALREAARHAAEAARATFDGLAPLARDARRRDGAPQGAVPPLLDAAFLVPARRRAKFQAAVRRFDRVCARAGAQLTLSGPWPPYNFVEAGEEPRA